jgi:hypothetical protein
MTQATMPTSPEFDRAVEESAVLLLLMLREDATEDDLRRPVDAAARAVQIHANRFDGLLPVADIDATMAAIGARARDLFADALHRRGRLSPDVHKIMISEVAKILDEEIERFVTMFTGRSPE